MPNYAFCCDECSNEYEEFRALGDFPKKCPSCGVKYDEGFHQDYSKSNVIGWTYGNPTTVGQQAEINTKKMGKERMQLMEEADNAARSEFTGPVPKNAKRIKRDKNYIPPWRDGSWGGPKMDKPLDMKKVKNVKKFIETGE